MNARVIRYTLRQLEYFVHTVELGSVARAAARLNVSQPSVSAALAKLEDQLGVQLLLRHHAQGVSATSAGERILSDARRLLQHASELERLADTVGGAVAGDLRLGSFVTLAPAFLPQLMTHFAQDYPDVRIRLSDGTQDELVEGLRQGRFEFALAYSYDLPEDLRVRRLAAPAPYVLLPKDHRLTKRAAVSLKELAEEPLVLLDVPPSRNYFLSLLEAQDVRPPIAFSSPSLELVRGLVGQGLGFSLLVTRPHGDVTYDGRELAIRPIAEPALAGEIGLAALRALRPTRVMQAFEDFCVGFFADAAETTGA